MWCPFRLAIIHPHPRTPSEHGKSQWVTLVTDNLPWPLYEGAWDPKATSQWVNMFMGSEWCLSASDCLPTGEWSLSCCSHHMVHQSSELKQGWERKAMMGSWHLQDWACLLNAGLLIQLLWRKKNDITRIFVSPLEHFNMISALSFDMFVCFCHSREFIL